MRIIKFGIIGAGLMGREFASACARWCHLTKMNVRPELVAVCDRNPVIYPWYRDNFPTIRQFTDDYHELLANPDVKRIFRNSGLIAPGQFRCPKNVQVFPNCVPSFTIRLYIAQ